MIFKSNSYLSLAVGALLLPLATGSNIDKNVSFSGGIQENHSLLRYLVERLGRLGATPVQRSLDEVFQRQFVHCAIPFWGSRMSNCSGR